MRKDSVTKSFTFEGRRYQVRAKTEAEAIKKMVLKQRDLEEGKTKLGANMTVSEWAKICIDTYKTSQSNITRNKYVYRMNNCVLDHIGRMHLKDVRPLHLQSVLNKQTGKSKYQIGQVYQMLNFLFYRAYKNNLIRTNPASDLIKPIGTESTRRAITDLEREHILKVADTDERFVYFLLMLFCSCRPSEAANLQMLDVKNVKGEHLLHIRGTKSSAADRLVPIPDYLYERLPKRKPFEYIVQNSAGNKLTETNRRDLWNRFKRELNISMGCKVYRNELIPPYPLANDFVPYCLRHTYCTDLQKKGIDIRTAQYLMGHSDIRMTANVYTHTSEEAILDAAKKIREKNDSADNGAAVTAESVGNTR